MCRQSFIRNLLSTFPVFLFFCIYAQVTAADFLIAWDSSLSAGVTGYKADVGTIPGSYGSSTTIRNHTTYAVANLPPEPTTLPCLRFASGYDSSFPNKVLKTIVATHTCNINGDGFVNALDA